MESEFPRIDNAKSLFDHYANNDRGPDKMKELKNDVTRADLGNKDFIEKDSVYGGQNPLFNILNAYASLD